MRLECFFVFFSSSFSVGFSEAANQSGADVDGGRRMGAAGGDAGCGSRVIYRGF